MNHFLRVVLTVCLLGAVVSAASVAPVLAQDENATNSTPVDEDSVMPTAPGDAVPAQDDDADDEDEGEGEEDAENESAGAGAGASGGPADGASDGADERPNQPANDSGAGAGGGPLDGVTSAAEGAWNSATPDLPSAEDIANDTAQWAVDEAGNATRALLEESIQFLVGTPTPENGGPNGWFGEPTNEPFSSLYDSIYGPISFAYSIVLMLGLLLAWAAVYPYAGLVSGGTYRAVKLFFSIITGLLLVMFWWPLGTMLAQGFDALALAIAPSPEELTSSVGDAIRLSLGPVLGYLALNLVGLVEVLGLLFLYGFRHGAIIVYQFAMPLILVFAYAAPHRRIRSMASTLAWQYFALLSMTLPTAFLMRVGYEVEWGFGLGALGNAVLSMSLFGIALAAPVMISIAAFRAPNSIQSLASGAAGGAVASGSAARSRVRQYRQDDSDGNGGGGGGSGGSRIETTRERVRERVSAVRSRVSSASSRSSRSSSRSRTSSSTDGGMSAEEVRELARKRRNGSGPTAAKARHMQNNDD